MTSQTRQPPKLVQRIQEIPYDHHDSRFFFTKRLLATRAAFERFGPELILECYLLLQEEARRRSGLDYLQVFEDRANSEGPNLWFIEDAEVVTALLPSDY